MGEYVLLHEPEHPTANAAGLVYEHRKVWYDERGPIPEDFHVHHINGDKLDNRIENLEIISAAEHGREHAYEGHAARWGYEGPDSPCHACGANDWTYRPSGRRECRPCGQRLAKANKHYTRPKPCPVCGQILANHLNRHIQRMHPTS